MCLYLRTSKLNELPFLIFKNDCIVGFVMFKDLSIFVASCIGFHTVQILVDFGGVVGVGGCSSFWHGAGTGVMVE